MSNFIYSTHCCDCVLSRVRLFATTWTVACHAPLSMGFSRQEYWSGLPFPSSGELLDPGMEFISLASPALAHRFFYHCTIFHYGHHNVPNRKTI